MHICNLEIIGPELPTRKSAKKKIQATLFWKSMAKMEWMYPQKLWYHPETKR